MFKRIVCQLTHGHDWVHAYARGYDGREVLYSRCRRCGHVARKVVRPVAITERDK